MKATIAGPKDTPYKGGIFCLEILFPDNYPERNSNVIFLTPIYHLNVCPVYNNYEGCEVLGHVSYSVTNWWKPSTTVREMLTKLGSIFYWPNPDSPYNLEGAEEFRNNRDLFNAKAKYFTKKYANIKQYRNWQKKDWDFSCDIKKLELYNVNEEKNKDIISSNNSSEEISLYISNNGKEEIMISCKLNELTDSVISRCKTKLGIKTNEILYMRFLQRLNLSVSIQDNRLRNKDTIILIYDVIFA